jgi:hypothetical protein
VVRATKLYNLAPNIFGPSVWHLSHITFLAHRIFIWVLGSWKNCELTVYVTVTSNSTYIVWEILGNRYLSLKCALFFSLLSSLFLCVLASCFRSVLVFSFLILYLFCRLCLIFVSSIFYLFRLLSCCFLVYFPFF